MEKIKLSCRICDSKKIKNEGKIINGKHPKSLLNKYSLLKCKNCGLKFIYPPPTDDEINLIYSTNEYTQWENFNKKNKNKSTRYLNFEYYSKIIKRYKNKGKLLDCGCATGLLLDIMKNKKFECYGVETSEIPYAISRKKHGTNIFKSNLENLKIKKEIFDVITMFDFIEHVKSPKLILEKTNKLLSLNGMLFIVTPDTGSLSNLIMKKHHNDYILEHLNLFNRKNIAFCLKKSGFEVIKINTAKKVINLNFAKKVFARHTNFLYHPINLISKIMPKKISEIPIKLNFGGMLIIAKKIKNID